MAARRIAQSSINWSAMAEMVPETQKSSFNAFKARSDGYLRKVLANPEKPPAIDWAAYQSKVAVPGLVESFKKQYEALQVPYPADKVTPLIDEQEKQEMAKIAAFIAESNKRIAELEGELKKWDSVLPFNMMTMEDFANAFPDQAWSSTKPTWWPFDPAAQEPPKVEEHH